MNPNTALQQNKDEKSVQYIPFGSADSIKLSVKIIQNMVAVPTKSGRTCSERDALRFLMLCQAQRLNPFAGDAFLIGYDGQNGPQFSLITAHQAFLKRAETCADFEGMESGVVLLSGDEESPTVTDREGDFHLPNENVVGGWARVHRKGRKDTYRRIRMARFNNGFAQWKVDPAGMIVKCAEADALRSTFPTLLGGLYTGEEQPDARAGRMVSEISSRGTFDVKGLVETVNAQPVAGEEIKGPAWKCAKCGQMNTSWATTCGRCESPKEVDNGEGTDLGPQNQNQSATQQQPQGETTPQQALAKIVLDGGFDFGTFAKWADESGNIPDCKSLPGFDDIKTVDCKRLLRATTGLLKGLAMAKGGAA